MGSVTGHTQLVITADGGGGGCGVLGGPARVWEVNECDRTPCRKRALSCPVKAKSHFLVQNMLQNFAPLPLSFSSPSCCDLKSLQRNPCKRSKHRTSGVAAQTPRSHPCPDCQQLRVWCWQGRTGQQSQSRWARRWLPRLACLCFWVIRAAWMVLL